MNTFEKKLDNFARLIAQFGINVQKGDDLIISSPVENPELARKICQYAYEAGAHEVLVEYNDEIIKKLDYQYQSSDLLNTYHDYVLEKMSYFIENRQAKRVVIHAEDPDLLKDLDHKKIAESIAKRSTLTKKFQAYSMNDIISWLVVSIPTKKWAMKVFEGEDCDVAVEKLWNLIFDTSRIEESYEKTLENWENHIATLNRRADKLNEMNFDKFHYQSSNGTDLTVEMPRGHIWMSADSVNAKNHRFTPNIPTEEVFSAPKKEGVNGKLYSVKPLVYNGNIIDEFNLTFKDGRVIDFEAKKGYETLKNLLNADEGAAFLGEIALVGYNSPISLSNVLFYNTLFDENASCHFALGKAYPTCVKGASESEDVSEFDINDSIVHEDFMVGAKDLKITAYKDGKSYPIFENGDWVEQYK